MGGKDRGRDRAARWDPAGQLLGIVRVVAEQVAEPGCRGCPFLNTHAEFSYLAHPAHKVSVAFRIALRGRLIDLAEQAGAPEPSVLADRIMLIVDGPYASGAVLGSARSAAAGVALAGEIIRSALASVPSAGPA